MRSVRIGAGAGYAGDRIEPAIDLMVRGELDYIIFECLAERTIAIAQKAKRDNPGKGYNSLLEYRFDRIFSIYKEHPVKIITNMGAANPAMAAEVVCRMAKARGIEALKIACVEGDDIIRSIEKYQELITLETNEKLGSLGHEILSANGYLGISGIVTALKEGADIIITGRVADPSLTLAPLVYEFGWSMDDYTRLGRGTLVGHLLECAGQVTGGYYADPGYKDVPELWNLGFPIIEVEEDGNGYVTKLPGTGGVVNVQTVSEQTLYEIMDPANYYTPDVTADFSDVRIMQIEKDKVRIEGADGKAPNGYYKTSIGFQDGYIGEGQISYGGENALKRARLAEDILRKRIEMTGISYEELRFDYIGLNSLYRDQISGNITCGTEKVLPEVRLRVAARTRTRKDAVQIGNEVEALYTNGPYGGGGAQKSVREIISILSVLIPAEDFHTRVTSLNT